MDDRQVLLGNLWITTLGNSEVLIAALTEASIAAPSSVTISDPGATVLSTNHRATRRYGRARRRAERVRHSVRLSGCRAWCPAFDDAPRWHRRREPWGEHHGLPHAFAPPCRSAGRQAVSPAGFLQVGGAGRIIGKSRWNSGSECGNGRSARSRTSMRAPLYPVCAILALVGVGVNRIGKECSRSRLRASSAFISSRTSPGSSSPSVMKVRQRLMAVLTLFRPFSDCRSRVPRCLRSRATRP